MRIARLLIFIVMGAAALIVGGVIFLLSTDVNRYRGEIAAEVEAATGRELGIAGPLALELTPHPAIIAEDLTLANAAWGSRPVMASIARAEATVRLWPLFAGKLEITSLTLIEPNLLLETDAAGRRNWIFVAEGDDTEPGDDSNMAAVSAADDADEVDDLVIPHINHVRIENAQLTYRDGLTGEVIEVVLARAIARASSPDEPIELALDGAWNGHPVSVAGQVGPFPSGSPIDRPIPVAVTARAFGFTTRADGTVRQRRGFPDVDLALAVEGEDLSGLAGLIDDLPWVEGPVRIRGRLTGDRTAMTLDEMVLTLGANTVAGRAAYTDRPGRPLIKARLTADRLDLTTWLAAAEPAPPSGESAESGQTTDGRDTKVFSPEPLPLDDIPAIDANVELSVDELRTPWAIASHSIATLDLKDGVERLRAQSASVAGGTVKVDLVITTRPAPPALRLDVEAHEVDLGQALQATAAAGLVEGRTQFSMALNARGRSPAQLMASLAGETTLLLEDGRTLSKTYHAVAGGITTLLGTLFAKRQDFTAVNCIASHFDIDKGVATSRVLLIDTEYSTVTGKGSIDLAAERIDFTVTPRAKSARLSVAVPVRVTGPLADPRYQPEPFGTARKVAGLLGIVLFPPAALVALGELGSGDEHPCLHIAAGDSAAAARDGETGASPAGEGAAGATVEKPGFSPIGKAAGGAIKMIEGVGSGLKKLFGD